VRRPRVRDVSETARERLLADLERRLAGARAAGLERRLRVASTDTQARDFSSNDYLGLAGDPGVRATLEAPPVGSTGSRSLSGNRGAWLELEERLAAWHADAPGAGSGARAALYFPSGYVANEGLLSTLLGAGDVVISDAWNHGSLIDGMRLSKAERIVVPHGDVPAVAAALARTDGREGHRYVVTESLFGMDGDRGDLVALADLCDAHGAHLVVDEAHATGCFGANGQGLVAELGLGARVLASIHTCGKALASHGAYVLVPTPLKDWLVQSCRHFIFTTALPEAVSHHTARMLDRVEHAHDQRAALRLRGERLREGLARIGLAGGPMRPGAPSDHIEPVSLGAEARATRWSTELAASGLRVPAIRYPTVPRGEARLRVSLRADHTEGDIDRLLEALETLARREGDRHHVVTHEG
jgi:8-amino-7-oxononanoate synthase